MSIDLINTLDEPAEVAFNFDDELYQDAMFELNEMDDPDPIEKQMLLQKYGIIPARLTEEERKQCT